jgi:ATP-dependent Clp protease ATP-binding subunit ClpA
MHASHNASSAIHNTLQQKHVNDPTSICMLVQFPESVVSCSKEMPFRCLELSVNDVQECKKYGVTYISPEHILLALLSSQDIMAQKLLDGYAYNT